MKNRLYVLILIYFLSILQLTIRSARIYSETQSKKDIRIKFIEKYTNKITKGKIRYEYSEEKGTYCKANTDLYRSEVTMSVPKDFIICGCNSFLNFILILVDIFPFKNELKAIIGHALHEFEGLRKIPTFNPQKVENYLQSFQLMFYSYSNKNVIWSNLEKMGKRYYIYAPEMQAMHYLETLPSVLNSYHMFSPNEFELVNLLGFQANFNEPKFIFNKVISVLQQMHPIEHRVIKYYL